MKIVFCGTGKPAVPVLESLQTSPHEVACVITTLPRRSGRGRHLKTSPAGKLSEHLGIDVIPCANINDGEIIRQLQEIAPDVIVVVDFGQMVSSQVRQIARLDTINLHFSLLPLLRGAAPVQWAIIQGHQTTGVSVFSLVDKMDAGDIYVSRETEIKPFERTDSLFQRLYGLGCDAVLTTLGMIESGKYCTTVQDDNLSSLAPKLTKADGHLDFSLSAQEIVNRIHGTWPWPGGHATFHHRGGKSRDVIIERAFFVEGGTLPAGTIDDDLLISTGDGRLKIQELKPAGKHTINWKDFCNGYRVTPGDCFTAPGQEM